MKNISNILLLTNLCVLIISIAIVFFWTELGLNDSQEVYIGLFGVIIFGLSLAGVFVGFLEKRNKEKKVMVGIIGNLIITIFFLSIFLYIISTMN